MTIKIADQKYKVFNSKNKSCPLCGLINNIFSSESFQKEMDIPEEIGKGYYRRIILNPSMEICISDVTFNQSMEMAGRATKPIYSLIFCLGDAFQWRVEGNKKEYEIACWESYIFNGNQGDILYRYNPGQRFWGLNIELDFEIITSLLHHLGKKHAHTGLLYGSNFFYKRSFSSAMQVILNDIMNCRYRDSVKRIYLEGKILELIALYMEELTCENKALSSPARFSSSDIQLLHKARKILEENIISPPTIGKLAKLVCLNEYKLKKGFKELFGLPVHAYVIDKRLERARFLLENEKLKVAEASQLVGYSESGRFAEKFRQKYGVNPSDFTKNLSE